jgi:transposase-like protein
MWSLCQMAAVRARTRCRMRTQTPVGVSAVVFGVELAPEGVVDRLDHLSQRLEQACSRPRCLPGARPVQLRQEAARRRPIDRRGDHRTGPRHRRLRLACCVVEDGWPIARTAERYQVSRPTATRWAQRYRETGPAGMADRSGRPACSPRLTPQARGPQDRAPAVEAAVGPGGDRRQGRRRPVNRASGADHLPDQPGSGTSTGSPVNRSDAMR